MGVTELLQINRFQQKGIPQTRDYCLILLQYCCSMSQQLKIRQPELTNNLVESPVKERERIHINLTSRQNISAMDIMGLSWIFVEDDYF